jgi:polyhydroxybutyrate depolymerase
MHIEREILSLNLRGGTPSMISKKNLVTSLVLLSVFLNTSLLYGKDFLEQVIVDGISRSAWVHLPSDYNYKNTYPVVLVLHGGGGNLYTPYYQTGMNELADREKFIVVYPEGNPVDPLKPHKNCFWNDGRPLADGSYMAADDVSYVAGVLDSLSSKLKVDQSRIYATGISNGAFMAYRLGKELSDRIAAIGTVAGVRGADEIQPAPPEALPIIHFHGKKDLLAPYNGTNSTKTYYFITDFLPVPEAMETWALHNGCLPDPVETLKINNAEMTRWSGGAADVVLWTLEDGGHTWPGGKIWPWEVFFGVGNINRDISASEEMWEFFTQYHLENVYYPENMRVVQTPLPPSVFLLGTGLMGLGLLGWRRKRS